jgi:hypothetical protein
MNPKNINASKVNAIIPKGVIDKPFTVEALLFNNMKEIWKDIKGYEGLYKISNLGRVKSLKRMRLLNNKNPNVYRPVNERILKPVLDSDGYYHIAIYKNGVQYNFQVHAMVWRTFKNIDYDKIKFKIDHIDNIKINNNIKNLQILSNSRNIGKGYQLKGKKYPTGITKKGKRYVARIMVNRKSIFLGSSVYLKDAVIMRKGAEIKYNY